MNTVQLFNMTFALAASNSVIKRWWCIMAPSAWCDTFMFIKNDRICFIYNLILLPLTNAILLSFINVKKRKICSLYEYLSYRISLSYSVFKDLNLRNARTGPFLLLLVNQLISLELNGPVNTIKIMLSLSVYLTTLFFWAGLVL